MTLPWLIIMIIAEVANGPENLYPLFWWLLVPFFWQDLYDTYVKNRR